MNPNIKQAIFTVGIGKGSMIILQFVSSIIIARLLCPEDYGITAMLAIFISISGLLIDSGFGGSLIYYKDVGKHDFDTIFWINLIISLILYLTMLIFANAISQFYSIPEISTYIKVLGLVVVFNSLGLIQFNQLYKKLEFKKINIVNLLSYSIAAIVAILLACYGYGVWALICQQVLNSVVSTITLIVINRFVPSFYFSWTLVKKHWSFGSGLFFSSILRSLYDNMYLQLIGKFADARNAGFFNQATKLKDIPASFFNSTFETSLFPLFSKLEDEELFAEKLRRISKFFAFITCPTFFMLSLSSEQVILVLLGEKWIKTSSLLSILSIGTIFYVLESINRSGLKAKGKSTLIFKIDLLKRVIAFILMFLAFIFFGSYGLAYAYVINSFIGWYINSIYLSNFCNYSLKDQTIDVMVPFLIGLSITITLYLANIQIFISSFADIVLSLVIFIVIYLIINIIIKDESLIFIEKLLRKQTETVFKKIKRNNY